MSFKSADFTYFKGIDKLLIVGAAFGSNYCGYVALNKLRKESEEMKKISIFFMTLAATFVLATTVFSLGPNGDFDNDGDLDGDDLAVFSENFGKTDGTCEENESCISDYE